MVLPFAFWIAITSALGAIIGSRITVNLDDVILNRTLAVIMLLVMGGTIFKPKVAPSEEEIFNNFNPNDWHRDQSQ